MRHRLRATALAVAAFSLSACQTAPSDPSALKILLDHAQDCDRDYAGAAGLGASFTFHIVCKAQPRSPGP